MYRQRGGGGVLNQKNIFQCAFFILNQEWCIFHLVNVQNSSAWDRNHTKRPQVRAHYMVTVRRPGKEATYTLPLPNFLKSYSNECSPWSELHMANG